MFNRSANSKDSGNAAVGKPGKVVKKSTPKPTPARNSNVPEHTTEEPLVSQMLGPNGEKYFEQPPRPVPEAPSMTESNELLIKDLFEHSSEGPNSYYWLMSSSNFWIQLILPQFKDVYTYETSDSAPLYGIYNERGHLVFSAIDTSKFKENRGPCKSFNFTIVDSVGSGFLRVSRRFRCFCEMFIRYFPCWCCGPYKNEAVIANVDSSFAFRVKQECRPCRCDETYYTVYDVATGHQILSVQGPGDVCALRVPHGITPPEIPKFTFKDSKDDVVAILRKTYADDKDSDNYGCQRVTPLTLFFPKNTDLKYRVIALGCTFLFDYMFFQK